MLERILEAALLRGALAILNDVVMVSEAEPINLPGPRIVYVNEAFERMTGFAASDVIGLTPRILQGPRSSRSELQRLRVALEAWTSCRICVTNYRKDGTPFDVEFEVVPVANDAGWYTHWVSIQREVTDRTLAAAVVDAAVTVEALVQGAGVEIAAYTGADGCAIGTRSSADEPWHVEYVRYEMGNAVSHDIAPPAPVAAAIATVMRSVHSPLHLDPLAIDLDAVSVRGAEYAAPSSTGMVILVWRAQSGAWPLAQSLLPVVIRRVGVKYDSLVAQRDRTRLQGELLQAQKLEAVGRLAGGVAHDFNNLLTVITGNLEFLREQLDGQLSHEPTELDEVLQAAERARGLVEQLMSISHRRASTHKVVDLRALVTSTATLLRRTLSPNIEVVTDVAPGELLIDGDLMLLEQALLNLALNARDAIESVNDPAQVPAHGAITIGARAVRLTHADAKHWAPLQAGPCMELNVSDTGPGMTEQVKSNAFEPFFTTKDVGAGTGLGLSSVLGTVANMSGTVRLEASIPHGVVVRMRFPSGTLSLRDVPDDGTTVSGAIPRTLLVVEDEVGVRKVIVRVLRSAGHHVVEAEDGTDALAKVATLGGSLSAVLTDVRMPVMGGISMARELRRTWPDLPVLFMSGNAEPDFVLEFGPKALMLNKPFAATQLLTALDVLFAQSTILA